MIIQSIKRNSSNIDLKQKNEIAHVKNNLRVQSDVFLKTNSKLSFTGLLGADKYGSQEDKNQLKYKVQLTPNKIDEIMKEAKTTDEGLLNVYSVLKEDTKNINKAFSCFKAINTQYKIFNKLIMQQIANANPSCSKIPVVNQITLPISNMTGSFQNKITKHMESLLDDFDDINEVNINKGLVPMLNDYNDVSDYFKKGIEYVNFRNGESIFRTSLITNLNNTQEKFINGYHNVTQSLESQAEIFLENANKILERQAERLNERVEKMTIKKIIRWGTIIIAGS